MIYAIPLALLQLTRRKGRLIVALAGIAFAVIMMFVQLGFSDALYDSNVRVHSQLQGEIVLINPQSIALSGLKSFSQRRLYQAEGFEEVKSVSPLYIDFAFWKNPENHSSRGIMVIGIDPDEQVLGLPDLPKNISKVKYPDVVLFDRDSRPEFGPIATQFNQGKLVDTEVGSRRIVIGGLFHLGTSFAANGTLITSDLNFLRLFPRRQEGLIDIGLVTLKPGADVNRALQALKNNLPNDVRVLSKEEFIQFEKVYWKSSTAIGFIFALGTTMGFMVGAVIVYQILYSDVSDHLMEYATLKAMGYKNSYLVTLIFQEAAILSILGYIPGFILALGLYDLTRNATLLPIIMTQGRGLFVMILTITMCCISGAIAIRKVQSANPADIF
jgi:putative ABC transport system permease protein